jgi:flavorubredoxin
MKNTAYKTVIDIRVYFCRYFNKTRILFTYNVFYMHKRKRRISHVGVVAINSHALSFIRQLMRLDRVLYGKATLKYPRKFIDVPRRFQY